jgi:hypothetical protein
MTGSGCGMGPPGPPSYSASLQRLVTAARRTHPVVSKLVKNGQKHSAVSLFFTRFRRACNHQKVVLHRFPLR